jgi:putative hydrolase of the HAD superfamily
MTVTRLDAVGPVRAVIVDFGGVVAEEGFREGIREIARRCGRNPDALQRLALDLLYESGYVTGRRREADFWEIMRQRTGIAGSDADLRDEIMRRFAVRPRMIGAVRSLRMMGYRTALLSDQTDWLDRLDERYGIYREFDRVFNSYYLGKGKRDPTVFDDAVRALDVAPRTALLVDDDEDNVRRAAGRGLQAVLFRDEGSFLDGLRYLLSRRLKIMKIH